MSFATASLEYRPLRVGFVVREGQIEDLVKAAGINSLLWGGVFNPVIPVAIENNEFAHQLVKLYSVDILHSVAESPETSDFIGKYPFLKSPSYHARKIFYEDSHTNKLVLSLLDLKSMVDSAWQNEFKSKSSNYVSRFALFNWDSSEPLSDMFGIQFGFIPSDIDLKHDYRNLFLSGLCGKEVELSIDEVISANSTDQLSLLDATRAELTSYRPGGYSRGVGGLYFGESNNFDDLATFWNVRAAELEISFLPIDHLERALPYAQSHVNIFNSKPNRHPNHPEYVTVYHKMERDEDTKAILDRLISNKQLLSHHVDMHSWNGLNIQPWEQYFLQQSTPMHIEPYYGKYAIRIHLPEKKFIVADSESNVDRQQLGVMINSFGDYNYPGYTLKVPKFLTLNEFYSREIATGPYKLRVSSEGITKIISASDSSISLYPLCKQALIEKIFHICGITAHISQPGRLATKVIEKIGGLEDARVLKIKGVRMILQKGSPGSTLTRGEATKIIFDNDFKKHEGLYIEPRDSDKLDPNSVFDYLLRKDFFRAGLELNCKHCHLHNWLSLNAIDEMWDCEYCGGENQTSVHLKHRGDWKFRKSGLFAKDNNQEGSVSVLLTLLAIKSLFDHSDFTYATALDLIGDNIADCESDFCVLQRSLRGDDIDVAIAECKSDGGGFDVDDCEKLKTVALQLRQSDSKIKPYIVFSMTNESFREEEIKLFRKLNKEVPVILFTNRELEPYHMYWEDGDEEEIEVPVKYAQSFADLNRNSVALYLADKSETK